MPETVEHSVDEHSAGDDSEQAGANPGSDEHTGESDDHDVSPDHKSFLKQWMCQLGLTQAVLTLKTLHTPLHHGDLHGNNALQTDMVLISLIDF